MNLDCATIFGELNLSQLHSLHNQKFAFSFHVAFSSAIISWKIKLWVLRLQGKKLYQFFPVIIFQNNFKRKQFYHFMIKFLYYVTHIMQNAEACELHPNIVVLQENSYSTLIHVSSSLYLYFKTLTFYEEAHHSNFLGGHSCFVFIMLIVSFYILGIGNGRFLGFNELFDFLEIEHEQALSTVYPVQIKIWCLLPLQMIKGCHEHPL